MPDPSAAEALRQVLDGIREAVVTIDAQGRVIECNHAAALLFGRPREAQAMHADGHTVPVAASIGAFQHAGRQGLTLSLTGLGWWPPT